MSNGTMRLYLDQGLLSERKPEAESYQEQTVDVAGEPLEIRWLNDSYIEIPVRNE